MARLKLGTQPLGLEVTLTARGDFVARLRTADGAPWPADVSARIELATEPVQVWDATVTGDTIFFGVDKAITDTVPDGTSATLIYKQGEYDAVWAVGEVVR